MKLSANAYNIHRCLVSSSSLHDGLELQGWYPIDLA
jgi:hypothetical protein